MQKTYDQKFEDIVAKRSEMSWSDFVGALEEICPSEDDRRNAIVAKVEAGRPKPRKSLLARILGR